MTFNPDEDYTDYQWWLARTEGGSWEHPSWAADGRHVVAESNGAIYIVDTDPEVVEAKERPIQLFRNAGHWMNPSWCR